MTTHFIMPVYGVEPYLADAIDSVLEQTCRDFELILVDDGSPDRCGEICDEYAARYQNVRVIHKENGGLSSARNAGLDLVKDGYIIFIDSDDILAPDILEKAVGLLERTNSDVVVFGMEKTVIEDGRIVAKNGLNYQDFFFDNQMSVQSHLNYMLNYEMWNYSVDKIYKAEIIQKNRIRFQKKYDTVCEDAVFLLDLFPFVTRMAGLSNTGYYYRIRDGQSIVKSFRPAMFERNHDKILQLIELTQHIGQYESCKEHIISMFQNNIMWSYEQVFHNGCKYSLKEKIRYVTEAIVKILSEKPVNRDIIGITKQRSAKSVASWFTRFATKQILEANIPLLSINVIVEDIYIRMSVRNAKY